MDTNDMTTRIALPANAQPLRRQLAARRAAADERAAQARADRHIGDEYERLRKVDPQMAAAYRLHPDNRHAFGRLAATAAAIGGTPESLTRRPTPQSPIASKLR